MLEDELAEKQQKQGWMSSITIEPYIFFYFFSLAIAQSATGILYPVKVCLNDFNYLDYNPYNWTGEYSADLHREICFHLEDNKVLDGLQNVSDNNPGLAINLDSNPLTDEVQSLASGISAAALGMQIVPAIVSTLILVNVADKIGRKPLFILPIFGYFFYNLSFILNWYLTGQSSWWLSIEALHECLGGRHVITVAAILYITDITELENRTFRLNIIGLLELVASAAGVGISGIILSAENIIADPGRDGIYNGFYSAYGISTILYIISIVYVVFFVEETMTKDRKTKKLTLSNAFSITKVKKTFMTVFRKRNDGTRGPIVLLCILYCLIAMNYGGIYLSGSLYLYFQKLGWSEVQYTTFISVNGGVVLLGCVTVVIYMISRLRVHDMTLGALGEIGAICQMVSMIVTPYGNYYVPYIGQLFNLFAGVVGTVCKSTLTKIVPKEEVQDVLAIFGMLIPITTIGPPIYNLLYKASLDFEMCESVSSGEKDWCSTTFIWFGIAVLATNTSAFLYLRLFCKKRNL